MLMKTKKIINRTFKWIVTIDIAVTIIYWIYLVGAYVCKVVKNIYQQSGLGQSLFYCSLIALVVLYLLSYIIEFIAGDEDNDDEQHSCY